MRDDVRKRLLQKGEIIPLTFDYVFTGIFNNVNNIDIVENFLAIYFKKNLADIKGRVEIKSRDLTINSKLEKNKQVDLLLDLDGEKINIELSNYSSQAIVDRNVVFVSKVHGGQLEYGDNSYKRISKTIQICLNNFKCNEDRLIDTYYLTNSKGKILTHKVQIDIVDLVKAKEKIYNKDEEEFAKFCRALLCNTEADLKKEIGDIMGKKAKEKLIDEVNKYSTDNEVVALYSAYTKEELERNTFMEEQEELKQEQTKLKQEQTKLKEKQTELKEKQTELKEKQTELKEKQTELKEKQTELDQEKAELKVGQAYLKQQQRDLTKEKEQLNKIRKKLEDDELRVEQTNKMIIKNLLDLNMKIFDIAKITGLSVAEVERLK